MVYEYGASQPAGIAFIVINDPHHSYAPPPCRNVCSGHFYWSDMGNTGKGYTHCCEIDEFRQMIPEVGNFPQDFVGLPAGYIPLLTN